MILNTFSDLMLFKSVHTCEECKVTMDMGILDQKVALLYVGSENQEIILDNKDI